MLGYIKFGQGLRFQHHTIEDAQWLVDVIRGVKLRVDSDLVKMKFTNS